MAYQHFVGHVMRGPYSRDAGDSGKTKDLKLLHFPCARAVLIVYVHHFFRVLLACIHVFLMGVHLPVHAMQRVVELREGPEEQEREAETRGVGRFNRSSAFRDIRLAVVPYLDFSPPAHELGPYLGRFLFEDRARIGAHDEPVSP